MKYTNKLIMSSALVGLAFMGINTSASAQFGGGSDRGGGGVSADVSADRDGASASVGVGGSSRSVGTGDSGGGGISADASVGGGDGVDADANVGGSDGLSADANVGGGSGGADANVRFGGAGTGTNATGDVDLNGTDGNNVVLSIGDNGILQRTVTGSASVLGGDGTNAAVNADNLDDVTATANVLSSAAADASITGPGEDGIPGADDGVAGLTPDDIRNTLSAMSDSEIAALQQKCPEILAEASTSDPDAVAVCQVVASL